MGKTIGAIIAIIILVGGAVVLLNSSDSNEGQNMANQQSSTTSNNETTETDDSLVQETVGSGGELIDYKEELLAESNTETNVLFFHAKWCSVCNAVERNLQAGNIPEGLRILKVDYDSNEGRALAEKYKIPIQYSMVQVDSQGNEVTQWVNQSFFTIENVLEQIQAT